MRVNYHYSHSIWKVIVCLVNINVYLIQAKHAEQQEESDKIEEVWNEFDKAAKDLVNQLEGDLDNKNNLNLASQKESLKLLNDQVKDVRRTADYVLCSNHYLGTEPNGQPTRWSFRRRNLFDSSSRNYFTTRTN